MRRRIKNIISFLLVFILLIPSVAKADANYETTLNIPVKVKVEGDSPETEFKVVIKAENQENDILPEETELVLKNEEEKNFGPIKYTKPGKYTYTISQIAGEDENTTYDDRVYTLEVYVENEKDSEGNLTGSLKEPLIVGKVDNKDEKPPHVLFENVYNKPETETEKETPPKDSDSESPKTGDDGLKTVYISLFIAVVSLLSIYLLKIKKRKNKPNID